ncbi:MAG: glycosyltransferase family 2 protein [Bacteroidales bacterium]|nr:glycosyltransferase family 2 protein [Bacteroidales bacterium]
MATAFVILHHRTLDVSLSCLDNLLKVAPESPIVVVDNGSSDGSGEELRHRFADYKNVVVIINDQNLGFAKGNNIGYKYVKDNFDVDCVVVMNNDVIITQPDFADIIANYMKDQHLDVCGPDVITPEGRHQNPLQREPFSTFRIIKWMLMDWIRLIMLKLHIFERKILATYTSVSNSYQRQDIDLNGITDCVLHGSCVAYSSDYLSKEDFAFVPVTFLYAEEMILADYCKRKKYRTGVCPTAMVTHLGGKTIMNGALPREKQIFKTRQVVKSLAKLLKIRMFGY